jgi:hypothetical protein
MRLPLIRWHTWFAVSLCWLWAGLPPTAQAVERSYGDVVVSVKFSEDKLTFTAEVYVPQDKAAEKSLGKTTAIKERVEKALVLAQQEIERRMRELHTDTVAAAKPASEEPAAKRPEAPRRE